MSLLLKTLEKLYHHQFGHVSPSSRIVLHQNLAEIEASDVLDRLGLEPKKYILLSAHREENIDLMNVFG